MQTKLAVGARTTFAGAGDPPVVQLSVPTFGSDTATPLMVWLPLLVVVIWYVSTSPTAAGFGPAVTTLATVKAGDVTATTVAVALGETTLVGDPAGP